MPKALDRAEDLKDVLRGLFSDMRSAGSPERIVGTAAGSLGSSSLVWHDGR